MSKTTVPAYSTEGTNFLARNPAVARVLGRSGSRTDKLRQAEQRDAYERGPATWHGIDSEGYYNPDHPQDWRGLDSANAMLLHKTDKPTVLGDKFRGPIFSTTDILKAPLDKNEAVHTETEEEAAVKETLWASPEDRATLGDPLLSEALYGRSMNARDLIAHDTELNRAYTGDVSHATQNQRGEIADAAAFQVTGVKATDLFGEGELGRLILENRGGLSDTLNASESTRNLIGADPGNELQQASRERVLDTLLPKLQNSSDIITEDVLRDHPLAAMDLLSQPELINWVEGKRDNARSFVQDIGRTEEQVRSDLPDRAQAVVGEYAYPFSRDWFSQNTDAAEVVVADRVTGTSAPYSEHLLSQQDELSRLASQSTEAGKYWTQQAKQSTGSTLPGHLLETSPSLSLLAAKDHTVAMGLLSDAKMIHAGYPNVAETSDLLTALRAYSIGLGERIHGVYERVA
ncbi:MAG: hypothetical protein V2A56_09165 [bacterium]